MDKEVLILTDPASWRQALGPPGEAGHAAQWEEWAGPFPGDQWAWLGEQVGASCPGCGGRGEDGVTAMLVCILV